MSRILTGTRYLIVFPILGLAVAASVFFIFGGYGLLKLLVEVVLSILGVASERFAEMDQGLFIFEVVEYVHTFLVGTVLYITAVGLYQLFIHEIKFPGWLKIDSTEELETNLFSGQLHGCSVCEGNRKPAAVWGWDCPADRRAGAFRRSASLVG